jgi:signal transduction histidine kinase
MNLHRPPTSFNLPTLSTPVPSANLLKLKPKLEFKGLRISQKIALGYFAALGIAIVGTGAGVIAGDRFYQQAREAQEQALDEIKHFQDLQKQMLQIQAQQQQLLPFVKNPSLFRVKHARLFRRINEFEQFWANFESGESEAESGPFENAHHRKTSEFIRTTLAVQQNYFKQLEDITLLIDQSYSQSAAAVDRAKMQLAEFANRPIALQLEDVIDQLTTLIDTTYQEIKTAGEQANTANRVRLNIIGLSMLGSIAVAAILAFLISRALSRPLQITTGIAQQVTQEDNFDLQAPVTTQDEIGALTTSLNELIQRMKQLLLEQKASEAQLVQSEKMSSLGQLVAGIAHEINNPVNFVHGNLDYAYEYAQDLIHLVQLYQFHFPHPPQVIQDEVAAIDLDFLTTDLEKLLRSMRVGTQRIQEIVLSLRTFSRLDEATYKATNLHEGIDSTLLILQHRLKAQSNRPEIQLLKEYGQIPLVECYSGQLNQVFMNLLANAIDVLEETCQRQNQTDQCQPAPTIKIETKLTNSQTVEIRIADNGLGMTEAVRTHLFDPFFTTKPVGVGTGLGLYISYQIVVDKHNGQLTCNSAPGKGAELVIQIPLQQPQAVVKQPEAA